MKPKYIFMVGAVSILALFWLPLWRITLDAPQYPDGVTMYIYINKIGGATEGTLQNINILNHYIGMKYIEPDSIPELTYFPYIVAGMALLGVLFGFTNKKWLWVLWVIILVVLGALGVYDFYLWEYDYGHNLSDDAPIKIPGMSFQPPLFGSKVLLNFVAHSYPHTGALFVGLAFLLSGLAIFIKSRKTKQEKLKIGGEVAPGLI